MILSCQNISKSFGTDEILKNVSFHIEENEKSSGCRHQWCRQSTLLKIIMKQENPDEGEVTLAKIKRSVILPNIRMFPATIRSMRKY